MSHWYERQMRILHPSLGIMPEEIAALDVAQLAADVAAGHYNAQHLEYTKVWDGEQKRFLFPTDKAEVVLRDVLGEYLPQAHKRGIKVFIYMNVHWANAKFINWHPDWVQRKVDGTPLTGLYGGNGTSCCVNSPWRDWVFELIEEMASRYDIDGIFFDGPCFYHGTCYCPSCQARFKERYGLDITDITDRNHPHWPEFVEFRYDSIAAFLRDGNAALKKHLPDAPLYMNANGLHSGAVNGRSNRHLIPHQDILGAEGGFIFYGRPIDTPLWKVSATARYLEAQAEGKPTVIFNAVGHKPWEYPLTAPEILLNTAATFACGANPWFGCYYKNINYPALQAVSQELAFFARHQEELSGTVAQAETAILWSSVTADYYGAHLPEIDFMVDRPTLSREFDFQSSFSGGYEALLRSGVPFRVVDEVGVERGELDGLRSLLITDAACMSEATVEAIRRFVQQGGHIIVTGHSSLYDERGHLRKDFALADVFGASYKGARGLSKWDVLNLGDTLMEKYGLVHADIPSPRYQIRVQARPGAEVAARYYEPTESRYSPKPPLSDDPAAVLNHYGKGTCLYLSGNWAAAYWTYRILEYQTLLSAPARTDPPLAVECESSAVEVSWRVQPQDGTHFIHLINYTGEMERPIKRIIPLHDITVRIRSDADPVQIDALRAGEQLEWTRDGMHVLVRLRSLAHHEVLRIRW